MNFINLRNGQYFFNCPHFVDKYVWNDQANFQKHLTKTNRRDKYLKGTQKFYVFYIILTKF